MELSRLLRNVLAPTFPYGGSKPPSLYCLCARTAAVYATTSLYEFHHKQKMLHNLVQDPGEGPGNNNVGLGMQNNDGMIQESTWEEAFPLLDQHFLQLVPGHLYEQFLDNVLSALAIAGHYDQTGKQLMQYITLFFPRHMKRFKAQKYDDRVLMPTICCLHKCTNIEELYLEKADSSSITTYLLAHVLKFINGVKVLALPKQCDDDVASSIGINCPKLESIVLTGTNVTNVGLSWLLCCRQLHTVIMPGFFQGITPKGVALLLNGLPGLKHVVYDVMSDVLTYIDFNTNFGLLPKFELKTVLFQYLELLSSNHLELVTKLCPHVEWLSLDSALFYNLEGLGLLPRLSLLRLNYKSRPLDQTVVDFFTLNCVSLTTLQLFDVKDLHLDDLHLTIGECVNLEQLVLVDCSVRPDWDNLRSYGKHKPLSYSVEHLQLISLQILPIQLVDFLALFRNLKILDMDRCELDLAQTKAVLLDQPYLHTLRCAQWGNNSAQNLSRLQMEFRNCKLHLNRTMFLPEDYHDQTMAATLLGEYARFSRTLSIDTFLN